MLCAKVSHTSSREDLITAVIIAKKFLSDHNLKLQLSQSKGSMIAI